MCGICGVVGPDALRTPDAVQRMTSILRHRGPDDAGAHLEPGVALGHRRLSIIDLSAAGHQPMSNEDGTVWLTYNGEIYNHRDIRAELLHAGHQYHSETDSETIIHAYEQWGVDSVSRFRGMFAFGLWDRPNRRFVLVRDRLGVKPLYYAVRGGTLVFASEIKAIFESGLVRPSADPAAVSEYFALGHLAGSRTMFDGVQRLEPGHYLVWEDGRLRVRQYWDVTFNPDRTRTEESFVEELRQRLDESVRLRLMSDVPIGVFLSGGLDSSAIAAITARHVPGRLNTFAVGFEEQYYSEFPFARTVAQHIGADHHEVVLTPDAFIESLPRLIWHEDEPMWGPPSVALYHVAALAAGTATVVLTGEGSDELFAGYDRYWMTQWNMAFARVYGVLPSIARGGLRRALVDGPLPERIRRALSHTPIARGDAPEDLVFDNWFGVFPPAEQRRIGTPALRRALETADVYEGYRRAFASGTTDIVDRMLKLDIKTNLVELLMKQDQMSMAASIESRVPFLDHPLVEFAATVPSALKTRTRSGKHLLKRAMDGLLPPSIIDRPKKGFPVPFDAWLRTRFANHVAALLLDPGAMNREWIDPAITAEMIRDHAAGRENAARRIWNLVSFELWARVCIDGQTAWRDEPSKAWAELLGQRASAPPDAVAV